MSATVLPLDGDPHQAVQALLPWYVNGRLDAAEAARVDSHLAACAACRVELEWEQRIGQLPWPAGSESGAPRPDPEHGLAQLHQRIRAHGAVGLDDPAASASPASRGLLAGASWLRWLVGALVGAQFAAIVGLVMVLVRSDPFAESAQARFHALGNPPPAAPGSAIVRFRPTATERDIRLALLAAGARLVGGPTANAAYVLDLPAGRQESALAGLRANPQVLLAESLVPATQP